MKLLFILEDGLKSTFYLFSMDRGGKKLLRMIPDQKIDGMSLGAYYQEVGIKDFSTWLSNVLDLKINGYIVLNKSNLSDFLFANVDQVIVKNPGSFTFHSDTPKAFEGGENTLDRGDFESFVTYQEDAPGVFGIFARQEHVLRLIKNELSSKMNPITIASRFDELKKIVDTNLGMRDVVKLFNSYKVSKKDRIHRFTLAGKDEEQTTVVISEFKEN